MEKRRLRDKRRPRRAKATGSRALLVFGKRASLLRHAGPLFASVCARRSFDELFALVNPDPCGFFAPPHPKRPSALSSIIRIFSAAFAFFISFDSVFGSAEAPLGIVGSGAVVLC